MHTADTLRAVVARIDPAATTAEFDAIWLDLMGLESVDYADEAGAQSIDDAREILRDWARAECAELGLPAAAVGLH